MKIIEMKVIQKVELSELYNCVNDNIKQGFEIRGERFTDKHSSGMYKATHCYEMVKYEEEIKEQS